jgi:hypothetical protein
MEQYAYGIQTLKLRTNTELSYAVCIFTLRVQYDSGHSTT